MNTINHAQVAYLRWLAGAHPDVYRASVRGAAAKSGLAGLGWINFVVQAVAAAGSYVVKKKQEKKAKALAKKQAQQDAISAALAAKEQAALDLLATNQRRATQGLFPVNAQGQPVATNNLPVPSELQKFLGGASSNYFPLLIVGGVLVVMLARRRS